MGRNKQGTLRENIETENYFVKIEINQLFGRHIYIITYDRGLFYCLYASLVISAHINSANRHFVEI
jgi:hypothetical protein